MSQCALSAGGDSAYSWAIEHNTASNKVIQYETALENCVQDLKEVEERLAARTRRVSVCLEKGKQFLEDEEANPRGFDDAVDAMCSLRSCRQDARTTRKRLFDLTTELAKLRDTRDQAWLGYCEAIAKIANRSKEG